jgi:hypothetical protein
MFDDLNKVWGDYIIFFVSIIAFVMPIHCIALWLWKETKRYFTKTKVYGFESSFQNCIWNILAPLVRLKPVK